MSEKKSYFRFTVIQRIEHWLQAASFVVLAITGLPQKFVGIPWAEASIAAMGGIDPVRIIHHYAATLLVALTIFHGGEITYKLYVERLGWTMLPNLKDGKDMFNTFFYNLGLRKKWARMPRYNFEEKMEYWSLVWGTLLMAITGFILWNPIIATKFLPGEFVPAAKAAHGAEAILAVLAIIIWHMYGVMVKHVNASMFSGNLTKHQQKYEHNIEYNQIETGTVITPAPDTDKRKRMMIALPVMTAIAVFLSGGLYFFVTAEDTAPTTAFAATTEERQENTYQPLPVEIVENHHSGLTEYNGPETCAAEGCHANQAASAVDSMHNTLVTNLGPNPLLAHFSSNDPTALDTSANCLICHAKTYDRNDLLGSAQTVGPAGGSTCMRCHSEYPAENIHTDAGLACISCHTSQNHQIKTVVTCETCHENYYHDNAIINEHYANVDCRACHIEGGFQVSADVADPQQDPVTGYYAPAISASAGNTTFVWSANGRQAEMGDTGAKLAPAFMATLNAPADLDTAEFGFNGDAGSGSVQETNNNIVLGHNISKAGRTCDNCHGPEAELDFHSLGYEEEQADSLSMRQAETTE